MSKDMAINPTHDLAGTAIIFDLDGTLIDTAADLAASTNKALTSAGLSPVTLDEVRHLVGFGARRMLMRGFELSAERSASDDELDHALEVFLDHYEANIAVHSKPFEHVIEMVKDKRTRGASVSICTNKREAMAKLLIEALGYTSLFDIIVGADTASAAKPDPAPVMLCLAASRTNRAVFIGDSDTDIRAAKAANIPSLIADFGYGPTELATDASAMFADYHEASDLIDSILLQSD